MSNANQSEVDVNGKNVTRVIYGNADSELGSFVQAEEHIWIEKNLENQPCFQFNQLFRDEWSAYLFDPARNVSIQLDLWKQKVLYKSGTSAYSDLYAIRGVSSSPASYLFASFQQFNKWYSSAGEARIGLPAGSTIDLDRVIRDYRARVKQITFELKHLQSDWNRLAVAKSEGVVTAYLKEVITHLLTTESQATELVTVSAEGKVRTIAAESLVEMQTKATDARIVTLNAEIVATQAAQVTARESLRQAQDELKGDKGFLNGFLTGITFTIYNPLQENIDKANTAVSTINQKLQQQKDLSRQLAQTQAVLAETRTLVQQLRSIDVAFRDFLNQLTQTKSSLVAAHTSVVNLSNTSSESLGNWYFQRTDKNMQEIFGWIDSFSSVV